MRKGSSMKAIRLAGLFIAAVACFDCASHDDFLSMQVATIATPATSGPICTYEGSNDVSGLPYLQVRCRTGDSLDFVRMIGWRIFTLPGEDAAHRDVLVTPALGQTGTSRRGERDLAFAADTMIPQSLYQQAAGGSLRDGPNRNCRLADSRQLRQLQWEFRFACL